MGRIKENWKVAVYENGKKLGQFSGKILVEALCKAEEKILSAEKDQKQCK